MWIIKWEFALNKRLNTKTYTFINKNKQVHSFSADGVVSLVLLLFSVRLVLICPNTVILSSHAFYSVVDVRFNYDYESSSFVIWLPGCLAACLRTLRICEIYRYFIHAHTVLLTIAKGTRQRKYHKIISAKRVNRSTRYTRDISTEQRKKKHLYLKIMIQKIWIKFYYFVIVYWGTRRNVICLLKQQQQQQHQQQQQFKQFTWNLTKTAPFRL